MTTKTKPARKSAAAKAPAPGRRTPILLIAFGAIAALLIVAILASGDEPIGSGGEYGDPVVSGEALPAMPSNVSVVQDDPVNGMVAPEITGQDFDNGTVSITHDGTPKAIVFLAHWCSHCQAEVPRVQQWLDSGGGVDGVEIISVTSAASSGQGNWPPSEWIEREGWTSPNIRDDQDSSAFRAYGGSPFPYWVFLNGDGTVALRMAGQTSIETLQLAMESLQPGG